MRCSDRDILYAGEYQKSLDYTALGKADQKKPEPPPVPSTEIGDEAVYLVCSAPGMRRWM